MYFKFPKLFFPGEGVINLALVQQRAQEIRVNGPVNPIRMEPGFSLQGGQGILKQCQSGPFKMQFYNPLLEITHACRCFLLTDGVRYRSQGHCGQERPFQLSPSSI